MISRLLKKNIPAVRLVCYTVANIVGLAILLTAVKFYADIRCGSDDATDDTGDYLVLQKPVRLFSFMPGNEQPRFSDEEIAELEAQPWVKRSGRFTAADFSVMASVEFAGRGMSTALFFEALPDVFVDADSSAWHFDPDKPEIPILIPRDYLALYNFGFAASRHMPQLSEDLLTNIPINIGVAGNGHTDIFKGRIAGLSSRLNTIAVPQAFMDWANRRYGSGDPAAAQPSRLMVETDNPGDPAIAEWLDSHDFESDSDGLSSGRKVYIAAVASSIIATIGIVISLLSIAILMLSIFLLIEKNRDTIRNLTLLGYTSRSIARFYNSIIITLNCSVTVAATVVTIIASHSWSELLQSVGFGGSGVWPVIVTALAVMTLVTILSIATVRRLINRTAI